MVDSNHGAKRGGQAKYGQQCPQPRRNPDDTQDDRDESYPEKDRAQAESSSQVLGGRRTQSWRSGGGRGFIPLRSRNLWLLSPCDRIASLPTAQPAGRSLPGKQRSALGAHSRGATWSVVAVHARNRLETRCRKRPLWRSEHHGEHRLRNATEDFPYTLLRDSPREIFCHRAHAADHLAQHHAGQQQSHEHDQLRIARHAHRRSPLRARKKLDVAEQK